MTDGATQIGIAVVEYRGHFLVGTRSADSSLPGAAEFPGGKCLPTESPQDCAIRECREETGLLVTPLQELHQQHWQYPHDEVELHFWLCELTQSHTVEEAHQGYRWVAASELEALNFPEANAEVIKMLVHGTEMND